MQKRLFTAAMLTLSILCMAACAENASDNTNEQQQDHPATQAIAPTFEIADTLQSDDVVSTILNRRAAVFEAKNTARIQDELYIDSSLSNQSVMQGSAGGLIRSSGSNIVKTGDSTDTNLSLAKGLNAAIIALEGSSIELADSMITTDAIGAGGVFSGGADSSVSIKNGNVDTQGALSAAITAGDGGYTECDSLAITTSGRNSAGISAFSGSLVDVRGGEIMTGGSGSPAIKTSGKVRIEGSVLNAAAAEAAVINGSGALSMIDTHISGNSGNGVDIYRTDDESANGMAAFSITGGSLFSLEGSLLNVTNSSVHIALNAVSVDAGSGVVLTAAAGDYGKQGSNGGHVMLNIRQQTLTGNIICDSISTVAFTIESNSTFTGMVNADNAALLMDVSLDKTSTWDLTGDSYVSAFYDDDASLLNIKDNGNSIYYDGNNEANTWLEGKTYILQHGGTLSPIKY